MGSWIHQAAIDFSPTAPTVGQSFLCWSPGHIPAIKQVGTLHVFPALFSQSLCTLGVPCSVRLMQYVGSSVGLRNSELAVVAGSSQSCEEISNLGERWANQWVSLQDQGSYDGLSFGAANLGIASGRSIIGDNYRLCWRRSAQEIAEAATTTSWGEAQIERIDYLLSSLAIVGPSPQDASAECVLGIPCEITLSGFLLGTINAGLLLCSSGYKAEMMKWTSKDEDHNTSKDTSFFGNDTMMFLANFMYEAEGRTEEALCWQATARSEAVEVGTVTLVNVCPAASESWPEKESAITLPAGRSFAPLYVSTECKEGSTCTDCVRASEAGIKFNKSAYFILLADDETMLVSSCSAELTCNAPSCVVELSGARDVSTGQTLIARAYVNERYLCSQQAEVMIVAFGCQKFVVLTFMAGVAVVLLVTVIIALTLEAIAKASVKKSLEGSVEIRCTGKEQPSFVTLRTCITQALAPDRPEWFDAWSSGSVVFARFRLPSSARPVRHWVTEVPGLCRVDSAMMREVRQPGRLPGAGLFELVEESASRLVRKSREEEERLHFEFATALLKKLRQPHIQALLCVQYLLTITTAVTLPLIAGSMMESCEDGYPWALHCVWGVFIILQAYFQWYLLSRSCPQKEIARSFIRRFWLRIFAGYCVGAVSQTDMYMDLTFPVIAKTCNFELWVVAVWLCTLGIGIGQVGQSVTTIFLGRLRARRATSPERRERAELAVLFFILRVTDNVALCFAVRPVLDERLGGSSSWAARVAEARVPAARFLFEDVEQCALQIIFLIFFDVATAADVVWIAASISCSLVLSFVLMVQVMPEIRDWVWYRLLAVVPRLCRIPLLFSVFVAYRFITSVPWLFACSSNVADMVFLGLKLRQQVVTELFLGIAMTTAGAGACVAIIYAAWQLQAKPLPKFQPPIYDAEARFTPKAFGAWSTEQDEWLEPLRKCMAEEADPERTNAMRHLDNELFKLRHGLSNKGHVIEALNDSRIPDAVASCGEWVCTAAQLREEVQKLLKNKRFTQAGLKTKSQMIDAMVADALSNTRACRPCGDGLFRLLPYRVLKNGIPRSSQGLTVSVSQAQEQAGTRCIAVIAVSHCWLTVDSSPPHPDNQARDKARSLSNFAEWYIRYWGNDIEVFYWIDYSCIDQDNRDISVALLPALIASCTAMVQWRTHDYEARSWTAMERVLAYSYCEGGLTPYVIDAAFTSNVQEPRWDPHKLPDPFADSSTSLSASASDKYFIQQLLQCVFIVPAFEVFPDRQSISFGQTEVVQLDLTCREPLRFADTVADGFLDGVDRRVWISAVDTPPATNIGMRVRTKDQVAMLMPADVVDTFVPILPVGDITEQTEVEEADLASAVAKFEDLHERGARPSEMDFAWLLDVLQQEFQAAMLAGEEQRLIKTVEISQTFRAFPPAASEACQHLCKPKLKAALKGSDRALAHAVQLAQQYGVDKDDFPEFKAAALEQDRRRASGLKKELERQISEASTTRDDILMFGAWQAASKAAAMLGSDEAFTKLADTAIRGVAEMMSEKIQPVTELVGTAIQGDTEVANTAIPGVADTAVQDVPSVDDNVGTAIQAVPRVDDKVEELHRLLVLAKGYGVEKCQAVEEARAKLCEIWLDLEKVKTAIQRCKADNFLRDCHECLKTGSDVWIYQPLLVKLIEWGLEQSPDQLQETLRVVSILGLEQEHPAFKAGVEKLREVLEGRLPDDWAILSKEWSQAYLSVQQSKVDDTELVRSIQALFDATMAGHAVATADRPTDGWMPTRLKVKRVMKVRHPGNYLRYRTCRAKMMDAIPNKEDMQELGTIKTDVAGRLPLLLDGMELNSSVNEVIVFHGTSYHAADSIAAQGFNIELAGSMTGSMFGRGAYFAERCIKSDEYASCYHGVRRGSCCNTERPILVCRVLLGKYRYTDETSPNRSGLESDCLEGDYDSVLADREAANLRRDRTPTYREFVVFDKDQVYPEYVVWYRRAYWEGIPKSIHPALEQSLEAATDISRSTAAFSNVTSQNVSSDLTVSDDINVTNI